MNPPLNRKTLAFRRIVQIPKPLKRVCKGGPDGQRHLLPVGMGVRCSFCASEEFCKNAQVFLDENVIKTAHAAHAFRASSFRAVESRALAASSQKGSEVPDFATTAASKASE